jgi:nicotinamide-nucleotide amidase
MARDCGARLLDAGLRIATAESCTGGLIASTCTALPGSSDWFECSFVTYRITAKQRLLGVADATLQRWGAVSEPTAKEMAIGALLRCDAGIVVSVTGVAGPSGGDVERPVGTVWFAWAMRTPNDIQMVQTARHVLPGNREQVRRGAVSIALAGVLACLASS